MREVSCVLNAQAQLGECPRWDPNGGDAGEGVLYWVDIPAKTLHRFDPATGQDVQRGFAQPAACLVRHGARGFALGMKDGFALLADFSADPVPLGAQVEEARPDNRFNDGRCDRLGRFWSGTLDGTKQHRNGTLYRLDADGQVTDVATGFLTSNGIAFSPDDRTFYLSDTPNHVIYAYDFDLASGRIANQRVFHQFPHGLGRPDGASVDAEGCYWTALYDGGRVARLSPQGEILEEVAIPARLCTMIAFGGPDLKTAYVTTARQKLDEAELARHPQSGGIFSFRVDVPGLPEHRYRG
ncbi:SMP-30/gluconolactonase/LRE family protein [Nitrospirillum sp. BR 11163]|uniref:SMP-30/gluconolactonase/LRE family protein n=1 Tax=Nitrospirillum sp. BR 11163 TaxID=3104323 RepID=UPI002AFFE847|nr:SMP-30/gluconolactonase/LRE family protein [Nitrospirillum sp. BR 11163]MEA1676246.1 SMP-30/gluconolactonase/LRE family protein [Nitrospirillum sp. BR 11163]